MTRKKSSYLDIATQLCQLVGTTLIVALNLAMLGWTLGAAFGLLPWLTLNIAIAGIEYPDAGSVIQIAGTLLMLSLLAYLPGVLRVMRLEHSHRDFAICMSDVADAYTTTHRADRSGAFTLSNEFDAVKERISYLRDHPDLGNLEPAVLEAAAEMSYSSRELAEVYSDTNVARARTFLTQRQQEIDTFNSHIEEAKARMHELRRWTDQVEIEESVMKSQLDMLESEFGAMLDKLGVKRTMSSDNLYRMPLAAE